MLEWNAQFQGNGGGGSFKNGTLVVVNQGWQSEAADGLKGD